MAGDFRLNKRTVSIDTNHGRDVRGEIFQTSLSSTPPHSQPLGEGKRRVVYEKLAKNLGVPAKLLPEALRQLICSLPKKSHE